MNYQNYFPHNNFFKITYTIGRPKLVLFFLQSSLLISLTNEFKKPETEEEKSIKLSKYLLFTICRDL